MAPNTTSNYLNHVDFRKTCEDIYDKCANLSHAMGHIRALVHPTSEGSVGLIVIVAYIGLIAVLTGADTFPAFRSMVNSFFKVNAIVRGLIGG